MKEAADEKYPDVYCPYCEAALDIEDPDDFETGKPMLREEETLVECPKCAGVMSIHVLWEPTFPYGAKAVE